MKELPAPDFGTDAVGRLLAAAWASYAAARCVPVSCLLYVDRVSWSTLPGADVAGASALYLVRGELPRQLTSVAATWCLDRKELQQLCYGFDAALGGGRPGEATGVEYVRGYSFGELVRKAFDQPARAKAAVSRFASRLAANGGAL